MTSLVPRPLTTRAGQSTTEVVNAVEEYIAVKIKEANVELVAQLKAQTWLIGSFGLIIAVAAVAFAFSKIAH